MRSMILALAAASLGTAGLSLQAPPPTSPLDDMEVPPAGYAGPTFKPSFAFPSTLPSEPRPWSGIDPKAKPEAYLDAVLAYVLEGQDTTRWDVSANPVRKWYHMPWMGPGGQGREFINGLTSERSSRPGDLGVGQTECRQNWAVGFYNPVGGYALGRIWAPVASGASMTPDLSALPFPEGTVVAKALYTEANATEVPILAGAPTIQARIIEDLNPGDHKCPDVSVNNRPAKRVAAQLNLLQLDVAIRDPQAGTTGWVFATFIYDGRLPGTDPWKKLRPVGLMWGNDPKLTDAAAVGGAKPQESVVFSDFGFGRDFGRAGRMNGPVDNRVSSCLSCHSTAQWVEGAGMAPSASLKPAAVPCYFRNLGPTQAFGSTPTETSCGVVAPNQRSLDYSLQLMVGVRNIAIADANAHRGGINIFGGNLFGRERLSPDRTVIINGVPSAPVSRDERVQER